MPLTRMLAEIFDVTGVDISIRHIELARADVPTAGFINADIVAVGFPPESFDAPVGSYSFIHVSRAEEHIGGRGSNDEGPLERVYGYAGEAETAPASK
jgi:ubiquinone/menaquinone biosynthesis C-methylase UbiE